jgi:hypothetical protein
MTCPDKYFLSSSFREINTVLSPGSNVSCIKHEKDILGLTYHCKEA